MARPRTHDENLRTRLLERASESLSANGPEAMSLRAVTSAAGTTTAAVYTLFGGRDGLVEAVVQEGFSRFGRYLAAVPESADPGADLLALGLAYRDSAIADPHFYQVMFGPGRAGAGRDVSAEPTFAALRRATARFLEATVGAGVSDAVVQARAEHLWGLAHGLVSLELAGLLPGEGPERAERYRAALLA